MNALGRIQPQIHSRENLNERQEKQDYVGVNTLQAFSKKRVPVVIKSRFAEFFGKIIAFLFGWSTEPTKPVSSVAMRDRSASDPHISTTQISHSIVLSVTLFNLFELQWATIPLDTEVTTIAPVKR